MVSSTSLLKRSARAKLKDKLKSEGVSEEVLKAVWGWCSLFASRHVCIPHCTPLHATEHDALPPLCRVVGHGTGGQSVIPVALQHGGTQEVLGRGGGCNAGCCGWMELVGQSHLHGPAQPYQQRFVLSAAPQANEAGGWLCALCAPYRACKVVLMGCLGWGNCHSFNQDLRYWLSKK